MLPQISENFNWPKPVTHVGLICYLSEADHWGNSVFILHVMDSST